MPIKIEDLLPDIHEYLETADTRKAVSSKGLEEMVYRICSRTGLDKAIAATIVSMFFHEIRNSMLRGDEVALRGLGKFLVSSPRNTQNKKRVFAKFKTYRKFKKKLNDKRSR